MAATGAGASSRLGRAGSRIRIGEHVIGWLQQPGGDGPRVETRTWSERHWAAARLAVQAHGVGPWLHARRAIRDAEGGALGAFSVYVAHCHAMNVRRHARWRAALEGVLGEAARRSLDLMPLKGAALIPWVWSEPSLRPTSDIDLLARPADRAAIDRLLRECGWTLHGEVPRHRTFYLAQLGLEPRADVGEHPDQPMRLEIHEHARQDFIGLRHECTDALWQETSRVPLGGATMLLASAGALFEHVLMHTGFDLAKRMTRFVKLEDLRLLAPRLSEDDWSRLLSNARSSKLERFYLAPLVMADRYLGPVAPPYVMASLEAATPRSLVACLRRTPLSYFTVCGSIGAGPGNLWPRLRWLPPGRAWLSGARRLVVPRRADRLDELAAVDRESSLWAYYRAHLARWRP